MGTLTIGVFSSLVGSTVLDASLKIAQAAIDKGHHVNFWTSGNAVMLGKAGQKEFKDYSHLQKRTQELIGKGMEVVVCEACALARGLTKEETLEGVKRFAMDWYLAKCFGSDRVLHIGGE